MSETDALVAAVRRVGAEEILPRFRALAPSQVDRKSGPFDLVTEADLRAEARLAEAAGAILGDALILGEEAVSGDPGLLDGLAGAERALVIDPVDGTWNFANGLPVFGTILALVERGRTVWGMIHDPVSDSWIETRAGGGTFACTADGGRRALRLGGDGGAAVADLSGYVHAYLFRGEDRARLFAALPGFGRTTNLRCSAWEYRMIAEARGAEFCLSPTLNAWDHLAGALAVTEAGGVARLLDGGGYGPGVGRGRLLVARSEPVWQACAAAFAAVAEAGDA